jgi:opacity protein-like surface antigen
MYLGIPGPTLSPEWSSLMRPTLACLAVFCFALTAFAQQQYVGRYDAYSGYTYASVPGLNLDQRGYHTQGGLNLNSWLSVGLDYSNFTGHTSLAPSQLSTGLQNQLLGFAASQHIPPSVVAGLLLPYDATTRTLASGPQLAYRPFKRITFLVHPGLGLIHESVKAQPSGALQQGVVSYFQSTGQLTSAGKKSDTTYFYGIGGGVEWNVTRNVHLRFTADYVHTLLFDGFLRDPLNLVRLSIGPTFNFGRNVARPR